MDRVERFADLNAYALREAGKPEDSQLLKHYLKKYRLAKAKGDEDERAYMAYLLGIRQGEANMK